MSEISKLIIRSVIVASIAYCMIAALLKLKYRSNLKKLKAGSTWEFSVFAYKVNKVENGLVYYSCINSDTEHVYSIRQFLLGAKCLD